MRSKDAVSHPQRFLVFVLAAVALTHAGCEKSPKLVIEDHLAGSWIAINNQFAVPEPADQESGKKYEWSGILLQVGDYVGDVDPQCHFLEVAFFKNGTAVGSSLHRTGFADKTFWVNIVSKPRDASYVDPMKPDHVLALLPGAYPAGHPCAAIETSSCYSPDQSGCLRSRKLHGAMERVTGVITYWQGAQGYDLLARQPDPTRGTGFELRLKDGFKVDVYTIDASGTVSPRESHSYGEIDLIKVAVSCEGPENGDKQDPPWPPPPPP